MKFDKLYCDIPQQIKILEDRGMKFENKENAKFYLHNISYYRLSAYWYTFLKIPQNEHNFFPDTTFQKALDTYVFDRKLRLILFNEIERIEITLRTQLICHYGSKYGNNWYEQKELYANPNYYYKFNALLSEEMEKTKEVFIRHYKSKYTIPENPPIWMALELASFGQLSMLFKNLKKDSAKKAIAEHFKISEFVLSSWLECLSYIRNTCAHHMRLWNRKLPKTPTMPTDQRIIWIKNIDNNKTNRLYYSVCIIRYLLNQISPENSFSKKIKNLFEEYPNIPKHYMGFTEDWQNEEIWK